MHGYWTIAGIIVLVLLLLLSGCAAHFTIHPGALNQTDSAAYDALLIAETAISEARQDLQTGALPDSTKAALNSLIIAYNIARESWLTYRGAVATNVTPGEYLIRLNQNLTDLAVAVQRFEEVK